MPLSKIKTASITASSTLTSPTFTTPVLGTPTSGTLTNCTGLPNAGLVNSSVTIGGTAVALGASSSAITSDITISGLTVGKGGGSVANNTALGVSVLANHTTNGGNVGVGYQALITNTTGFAQTAVGRAASYSNTTGANNVSVGAEALYSNTTGSYNVSLGVSSLYSNTTASNNTAVGYGGLQYNITGTGNSALGYRAGWGVTSNYNTAIGMDSMSNASGGVGLTSSANNTAVGYQTFYNLTSGGNNTAVGYQAGYTNTTGLNNTIVGSLAGDDGTFNYSTIIGARAGGNQTSGDQNTYVGEEAGGAITTGSRNTLIGRYTGNAGGLDIRTATNYVVLSDGDGNPRAHWNGSGAFSTTTTTSGWSQVFTNAATGINTLGLLISWAGAPNNTAGQFINCSDNANARFIVYANGNTVNQNNSYGAVSDIKLKENIVDATPKLEDLCKVKVRQYNLKSDPTHKQIGVVAQELEEVFAGMVEETPDKDQEGNDLGTTTKGVKYSVFVPMLIKSIQELKTIVDAQAAEIAELKAR